MSLRLRKSLAAGVLIAGMLFTGIGFPATAHAQSYVSASVDDTEQDRDVPDEVLDEQVERDAPGDEVATEVLDEQVERDLAFTGTDAAMLAAFGAGSIVLGGALLVARRRHATT